MTSLRLCAIPRSRSLLVLLGLAGLKPPPLVPSKATSAGAEIVLGCQEFSGEKILLAIVTLMEASPVPFIEPESD